jgi:hypothetical protein
MQSLETTAKMNINLEVNFQTKTTFAANSSSRSKAVVFFVVAPSRVFVPSPALKFQVFAPDCEVHR